jgi:hypothetical protein
LHRVQPRRDAHRAEQHEKKHRHMQRSGNGQRRTLDASAAVLRTEEVVFSRWTSSQPADESHGPDCLAGVQINAVQRDYRPRRQQ